MLLSFFTEEAYDDLFNNIDYNSSKYFQDDDWLDSFFRNRLYKKQSRAVDVHKFIPVYSEKKSSDEQKSQDDLINTRLLYDAFKSLTPTQASNKFMWTYLCHAEPEYRRYIVKRWTDLRVNTIKTRFFVTSSKSSLFDNSLSRLWWYAHLTYDKSNSNPYSLTEVLLINQTICTDFIDTYNSRNLNRAKGVLGAVKDFKDILNKNEGIVDYFRACNKYLNRYAAVTNIDYLESHEIKQIALDYMNNLRDNKLLQINR